MASVLVLQVLHDYSDSEAAEAAGVTCGGRRRAGSRWMMAGLIPPRWCTGGGGWRARIARTGSMRRSRGWSRRPGCWRKGRRRRAVDSTILADAVATQDTITQLIAAIRRVARVVPGAAGQVAELCTGCDYSSAGKPQINWDDPQAKDSLVSALVNDAHALLAVLDDGELDERAASALGLLALVAGQDVEPAEGSDRD